MSIFWCILRINDKRGIIDFIFSFLVVLNIMGVFFIFIFMFKGWKLNSGWGEEKVGIFKVKWIFFKNFYRRIYRM